MSDTPETDTAVKESNGQWSFVLKETCQRLERERNKAVEDATNYYAKIGGLERERDEARKICQLAHDRILRGDNDREILDILAKGWRAAK